MTKKGKTKKNKILKYLKKIGLVKFLKRNGLILSFILMALMMIISIIFTQKKYKIIFERESSSLVNKMENNNLYYKIKPELQKKEKNIVEKKEKKLTEVKKEEKFFSCNDILKSNKLGKENGIYEINIRGKSKKLKVYCDMTTSGGGWTLLLTSASTGWNSENIISRNSENPSIMDNYSILGEGDRIRSVVKGIFQYRIDANNFGKNGGVWETYDSYSFLSKSSSNIDINLLEKYGNWEYSDFGIEKRMPYLCNTEFGILSTSENCTSKWYGTLAAKNGDFIPAPWIHLTMKEPGIIWYWVR